ncbi:MAG: hypothetical protein ACKPKO_15065 [Candidatus Fonsibacter sp.]
MKTRTTNTTCNHNNLHLAVNDCSAFDSFVFRSLGVGSIQIQIIIENICETIMKHDQTMDNANLFWQQTAIIGLHLVYNWSRVGLHLVYT